MNSSEGYRLAEFEEANINSALKSTDSIFNNSSEVCVIEIASDKCQHADFNSMSTVESNGSEDQVSRCEINWAELPSPALLKIYSFLSRPDRSNMSLVCSRWEEDFSCPSLWRTMKFHIPARGSSPDVYPEIKFARKYGSLFQHVEILGSASHGHSIPAFWSKLKLFLQAMESSSQLIYIKFYALRHFFSYSRLRNIDDGDLFQTLISFFNSQYNLKMVHFEGCSFIEEDCMELLKAVFHSNMIMMKRVVLIEYSCKTERILRVLGIYFEEAPLMESPQYLSNLSEVCLKIASVQLILFEYTQMFEDLIKLRYEKHISGEYQFDEKKPIMSSLNIYIIDEPPWNFNGTQLETWKYLINAFPTIKREMYALIRLCNYVK